MAAVAEPTPVAAPEVLAAPAVAEPTTAAAVVPAAVAEPIKGEAEVAAPVELTTTTTDAAAVAPAAASEPAPVATADEVRAPSSLHLPSLARPAGREQVDGTSQLPRPRAELDPSRLTCAPASLFHLRSPSLSRTRPHPPSRARSPACFFTPSLAHPPDRRRPCYDRGRRRPRRGRAQGRRGASCFLSFRDGPLCCRVADPYVLLAPPPPSLLLSRPSLARCSIPLRRLYPPAASSRPRRRASSQRSSTRSRRTRRCVRSLSRAPLEPRARCPFGPPLTPSRPSLRRLLAVRSLPRRRLPLR